MQQHVICTRRYLSLAHVLLATPITAPIDKMLVVVPQTLLSLARQRHLRE